MAGSSKLSCIGIVGDGCGGGREFFIENETLYAKDPITKEHFTLLEGIQNATSITKKGCTITIKTKKETILFDLSSFSHRTLYE